MMLGGLPPKNETKNIGETTEDLKAEIDALKKEVKWMKWAIVLLIIFALYQQFNKSK